jgi:hypothetical protein
MDDLFLISPEGIRPLFPTPEPDHQGPPRTPPDEKPAGPLAADAVGVQEIPDETPPVPEHPLLAFVPSLDPEGGKSYVLQDQWGRILGVQNNGAPTWDWAHMIMFKDAPGDLFPITFVPAPTKGDGTFYLMVQNGDTSWYLRSAGTGDSANQTFWAPAGSPYNPSDFPYINVRSHIPGKAPETVFEWPRPGSPNLYFQADGGADQKGLWVRGASTPATSFKLLETYIKSAQIGQVLQKEWPNAKELVYKPIDPTDSMLAGISDQQMRLLLTETGLTQQTWTPEVFDCDDFGFVLQAAACKAAYLAGSPCRYAVGVLFGVNSAGLKHVVNLYLDPLGNVKVIEPQNGTIVNGKNWDHTPLYVLL